ncbi:hypothetical protein E2A40_06080 [Salmonella enterica subsp. enterica serovar Johannesburg]|uniref:Uncharacterized protein n=3 Tax=Salmonella enterica TaxID=28901 RepID=A0A5X9Y3U6_SALET|nr:hypothetical protein LFZ19_18635 [Salmonella enterica subsp. enterica serovar Johannesburg str. ST203]EAA6860122.1 hypothetical protein [Salmonella enterica subsp. enterica serovar Johannesburg]EAA7333324.1 hypothetical protein [Salmonella enterica subsp. enterica]EAA7944968.1 hypothetical protein [Salmonella enterica]ECH8769657.1 hypothetical protein [Salmonella enterica subsp. enterica serovar Hvittingfoss]HAD6863631.1 hypothetical protein [Salmonella enterica subsp. enterica serovar Typh
MRQAYELTGIVGLRSAAPSDATINRYSEKSFSDTASLNAAAIGYTQAAVRDIQGESICASAAR